MPSQPKKRQRKVPARSAKLSKRAGERAYTVVLTNRGEAKRLGYRAASPADVVRQIVADWIEGRIVWTSYLAEEAFPADWLKKYGYDARPTIIEGTRLATCTWSHCADPMFYAHDEEVRAYILW